MRSQEGTSPTRAPPHFGTPLLRLLRAMTYLRQKETHRDKLWTLLTIFYSFDRALWDFFQEADQEPAGSKGGSGQKDRVLPTALLHYKGDPPGQRCHFCRIMYLPAAAQAESRDRAAKTSPAFTQAPRMIPIVIQPRTGCTGMSPPMP